MPSKRHDKRQVHFLTRPEIEAILAVPDRTTARQQVPSASAFNRQSIEQALAMAGVNRPIGRLTLPPETIASCYRRRHTVYQPVMSGLRSVFPLGAGGFET